MREEEKSEKLWQKISLRHSKRMVSDSHATCPLLTDIYNFFFTIEF